MMNKSWNGDFKKKANKLFFFFNVFSFCVKLLWWGFLFSVGLYLDTTEGGYTWVVYSNVFIDATCAGVMFGAAIVAQTVLFRNPSAWLPSQPGLPSAGVVVFVIFSGAVRRYYWSHSVSILFFVCFFCSVRSSSPQGLTRRSRRHWNILAWLLIWRAGKRAVKCETSSWPWEPGPLSNWSCVVFVLVLLTLLVYFLIIFFFMIFMLVSAARLPKCCCYGEKLCKQTEEYERKRLPVEPQMV